MEINGLKDCELERYITEIMLDMGVLAHLRGVSLSEDGNFVVRQGHGGSQQCDEAAVSDDCEEVQNDKPEGRAGNPQCNRGVVDQRHRGTLSAYVWLLCFLGNLIWHIWKKRRGV